MISIVVMAALSVAPEANANIFKRTHHAAPSACCGAPEPCCAPAPCCGAAAPAVPSTGGEPAKTMPKGDAPKGDAPKGDAPKGDAPKGDKATPPVDTKKADDKKAEAAIEIPANLKEAINKSDQKAQILEYLANTAVPREKRIQYLETVRQTLLPDPKK